jgi:ceramide glucosyltransferase
MIAVALTLAAAAFSAFAILCHVTSIATVIAAQRPAVPRQSDRSPPVSIVRTLCERDNHLGQTLASTFTIDYPDYEILFCAARETDGAVATARAVIAAHPDRAASLLIGEDRISSNPKLNNLAKGFAAARHDLLVFVDSNVLMPEDYLREMVGLWKADTGVVTAPPIGSHPETFWAEMECSYLNTYQGRWQLFANRLGIGYAHGKNMLLRKSLIDDAGGIRALAIQPAEDASVTKIARSQGLRIELSPRPFTQPLGRRTAREVWDRQVRWAKLRRRTFPIAFIAEPLSGSLVPLVSAGIVAAAAGASIPAVVGTMAVAWYGGEALLARTVGWHFRPISLVALAFRDLTLPFIWIAAWASDVFEWGGQEISTTAKRVAGEKVTPPAAE